ncbi:PP2C family protein-serine/threonine phosphatase [Actinokineospora inagensis]|uniref:PP2C family protein-serine/threonine phosphatase n=1 Tax=Actinokineospora inagensis TaxID=103730 RepID=UPI00040C1DDF|nr:SpoIIE family protein phosphatase [Actinokineospora inagensis]
MHPNRDNRWPDRLHSLWRSAFAAVNTRQFADELYTGLLALPGVHGILGVRYTAAGAAQVTRWADAGGLRTGPAGLSDEVSGLPAAFPLGELAHRPVTDLPGIATRIAACGADGLLVTAFEVSDGGLGLLGLATAGPPDDAVLVALTQAKEVVDAAERRIGEQREMEDQQAVDALLAEASLRMDASLDIADTLRAVLRLVVPALADGAAIHIQRDGRMVPIAAAHVNAQREELLVKHLGHVTGDPVATDEPHPSGLPAEVGLDTMTTGVLRARGRDVGLLTFFDRRDSGRQNSTKFLRDLAGRAALAIDNATLYEQRRADVLSLQQHLLPAVLPTVPGLELAAGYNAADHTLEVGGDFYGVVDRPGGEVVALVGDVCGRGAQAAALTGLARHTLETVLAEGGSPRHALGMLNQKMLDNRISRFLTIATATLTAGEGVLELEALSAGHPPPLVVRRDGAVEEAGCTGRLLGVLADLRLRGWRDRLRPGDLVILFSDGLIEARDAAGGFFGDVELARSLRELRSLPLPSLVDGLISGSDRYHVNDDVAVLAIRYLGPPLFDQVLPAADVADAVTAALRDLNPALRAGQLLVTGPTRVTITGDSTWARLGLHPDPNGGSVWTDLTA